MGVLAFLIGVVVMVIGLGVSIALHEIGHLVPAKRFGVRVGQYMIGMGPTVWSKRRGETEYGLKAFPIGGYISMAGMYPAASADAKAPALAGAASARETRRRSIYATLVQDAQAANEETLDGVDASRTFSGLSVWKRVVIMLGGPLMNLVLAVVLFAVLFSGIGMQQATTTVSSVAECVLPAGSTATECADGDAAAPALAAGIEPGDSLVSLDGTAVSTFAEASAIIQANPGRPILVVVERDGADVTLTLTPIENRVEVTADDGSTSVETVGYAGITSSVERVREPIWAGPQAAFENVGAVVQIVANLPARLYDTAYDLFTGGERDADGPMSVVGVGRLAGEVAAADAPIMDRVGVMVSLLASLNIALFVFNLVPLLPLDGGHILVALWDGVRRAFAKLFRRPPPAPTDATRLVPVTLVVVVLLVGMGALLFAADIFNPVQLLGG
ncbi:site-2 protease family protein [Microbacterium betulae]|uniref:Site-2 protease family protein n=1 Tax=Microbacterium betulae TaxID=2981139 RepID=A0AA97FEL1_9MICO|nr:site-2 protease family protein [Microbacterium sp. AB]WOF22086.1 site-2 protease family protein [Microbacterium sp. AB]